MAQKPIINTDKFGQSYQVVAMTDKKGTGYPSGYVELKGVLYKLEPGASNKAEVAGWLRITAVKKRTNGTM